MALKRHTPKMVKIMDGDEEVGTVHGLSFSAIVGLININRPAVEALFDRFAGRDPSTIAESEVSAAGMSMLENAPILVAQIISEAADAYEDWDEKSSEPSPVEQIMAMELGLQWAFLEQIAALTFNAGGGAKKMLTLALKAARNQGQSRPA